MRRNDVDQSYVACHLLLFQPQSVLSGINVQFLRYGQRIFHYIFSGNESLFKSGKIQGITKDTKPAQRTRRLFVFLASEHSEGTKVFAAQKAKLKQVCFTQRRKV
jgi:hypothetical protein